MKHTDYMRDVCFHSESVHIVDQGANMFIADIQGQYQTFRFWGIAS